MEEILKQAEALGDLIAKHERNVLFVEAQKAVNTDPEARTLIEEYQTQALKIRQLEQENKPVEVDDKHKLKEIESKISLNEKVKELTRRQADFVELMQKVNKAIDERLIERI